MKKIAVKITTMLHTKIWDGKTIEYKAVNIKILPRSFESFPVRFFFGEIGILPIIMAYKPKRRKQYFSKSRNSITT
ncbi:hypothetical protein KAJ27_14245 [bacterium]|nr:hypothetical protein [bacterium]